jgi:3-deoxy-D-manno-octulosonic-acid transferase
LKKIKKEFPHSRIVLTTMTSTGNETAKSNLPETDQVLFIPIDHPLIIRRTIKKIQPGLLLIAETELWPKGHFDVTSSSNSFSKNVCNISPSS